MAKHKRKPARTKSIASHQLFPAVVALWFGALFGLGSLAVRPSLIENLVLQSRLDLVVPAAAPPLGVTARMLVALILATVGAIIGTVLARRLARPKAEVRERKRMAPGATSAAEELRGREANGDAPACKPISISEDLGAAIAETGNEATSGRRRALAIEPEEDMFVPHDHAPLPGGSPQIQPVELSNPSPLPMAAAAPQPEVPVQSFQPQSVLAAAPAAPVAALPDESAVAHADGRQVFGMTQHPPEIEQPRQIFGAQVEGDHVSRDFVRQAGYRTTVFDAEPTNALFSREPQDHPAPASLAMPVAETAPAPSFAEAAPAPLDQPSLDDPAAPGMTELAMRLTESMRRRRAARSAASAAGAPAPEAETIAAPAPVMPAPAMPAPAGLAADFAPPQPAVQVTPEPVVAAPARALPEAMRPLALDAFIEEDSSLVPGIVPPRHIAMPLQAAGAAAQVSAPGPQDAPQAPSEEEAGDEELREESYGSLLGLNQPRGGFVRIEEPQAAVTAPEPVVIFPGQAPLANLVPQPAAFTAPASPEAQQFRRFDGPETMGHGQTVAAGNAPPSVDSQAADQALRSALANLQRMSGAA